MPQFKLQVRCGEEWQLVGIASADSIAKAKRAFESTKPEYRFIDSLYVNKQCRGSGRVLKLRYLLTRPR